MGGFIVLSIKWLSIKARDGRLQTGKIGRTRRYAVETMAAKFREMGWLRVFDVVGPGGMGLWFVRADKSMKVMKRMKTGRGTISAQIRSHRNHRIHRDNYFSGIRCIRWLYPVIPAKAGIQKLPEATWVPAFAGTTAAKTISSGITLHALRALHGYIVLIFSRKFRAHFAAAVFPACRRVRQGDQFCNTESRDLKT